MKQSAQELLLDVCSLDKEMKQRMHVPVTFNKWSTHFEHKYLAENKVIFMCYKYYVASRSYLAYDIDTFSVSEWNNTFLPDRDSVIF